MADTIGLRKASDREINKIQLVSSNGNELDIRDSIVELSLFQDIYSPVMSGQIVITDGHDLVSTFGLCGNDYIRISIDKPTLNKPFERLFRIYKISNRQPNTANDVGLNYLIHFCSEEMLLSLSTLVSKSYSKMPYSNMIVDICQNFLNIPEFNKNLIETTGGNYSIIIPNLRPFEAINFLASRSFNGNNKHGYFFFETRDGYQFSSLQSMFASSTYATYALENKRLDPDPSNDWLAFNEFRVVNDFDVISMMSNGGYAAKLLTIDPMRQKHTLNTYSQADRQAKKLLMNKYLPFNDYTDRNGNKLSDNYDSFFRVATTFTENIDQFLMNRTLSMALMNNFKINYNIPGDIMLKPGLMVQIKFPVFEYSGTGNKKFDERRDGANFLITSVRHQFIMDTFSTIVEVVQDSFIKSLPNSGAPATLRNLRK